MVGKGLHPTETARGTTTDDLFYRRFRRHVLLFDDNCIASTIFHFQAKLRIGQPRRDVTDLLYHDRDIANSVFGTWPIKYYFLIY
jgi:hypothetical protein